MIELVVYGKTTAYITDVAHAPLYVHKTRVWPFVSLSARAVSFACVRSLDAHPPAVNCPASTANHVHATDQAPPTSPSNSCSPAHRYLIYYDHFKSQLT